MKNIIYCALLLLSFLLSVSGAKAQTTNFDGLNKIYFDGYTAALKQVRIDRARNFTYVSIELEATRKIDFIGYPNSKLVIIKSADWSASLMGVSTHKDQYYHNINCGEGWNSSNAKIGDKHLYTLVFIGAIPPGLSNFSLVDDGTNSACYGLSLYNYNLNNPDNHPTTHLDYRGLRKLITDQDDPIVGLYESSKKTGYRFACIKEDGIYKLVFLSYVGKYMSWWKEGDLKATLFPTSVDGLFEADWYLQDKNLSSHYIKYSDATLSFTDADSDDYYYKVYPSTGTGTGFAISPDGYIVTNYHVIRWAKTIEIAGVNGDTSLKLSARVIIHDEGNDLAILKIDDPRFKSIGTIPYAFRDDIAEPGEEVFALGYPLIQSMGKQIKLTNGIISAKTGFQGAISTYQISVPVQGGNSGSPLFDKNGNLLGIVSSIHTESQNTNYAIKVSHLKNLIDHLPRPLPYPQANKALKGKNMQAQAAVFSDYTYLIWVNAPREKDSLKYTEKDAAAFFEKAQSIHNEGNGDFSEALRQINLAIEAAPNDKESYFLRGLIYQKLGNYEKAVDNFTKAIQLDKNLEKAYIARANMYRFLGQELPALRDLTTVISFNSNNTHAYFSRALIKSGMNDEWGAIADYDEIIKREGSIQPDGFLMGTVYNNKGYSLVELGRLDEGLPFIEKGLKMEPQENYIWGARGIYHYKKGNYRACIADLQKSLELVEKSKAFNQDPPLVYYYLGLAKIKLGQQEEGCRDLSKAGELGYAPAFESIKELCNK